MSHLAYLNSAIADFITNKINYIGYQLERETKKQTQCFDAISGILINFIDVDFGVLRCLIGIIVRSVFNPIDTITNIISSTIFSIEFIIEGIANTGSDII